MKNGLLTIIFSFLALSLIAQKDIGRSVIYTNDGSVYVGEIVSENILDIKMVIGTMDTITIDKRSVKKMSSPPQDIIMYEKGKYHRTGGLFYSFHLLSGVGNDENATANLSFIIGKRLNEKWHLGLGYGISSSTVELPGFFWEQHTFQNIFAYGRYNIKQSKVMLFADTSLGVGIAGDQQWRGSYTSGVYFQPGIGIEFASRKKLKWSIKLSQYMQNTSGVSTFEDNFNSQAVYSYNQFYNRTLLGVGLTF